MKRMINMVLPSVIVLTLALGATGAYAYYTAQTETTHNSFNIVAGGGGTGINGGEVGSVDEVFDPEQAKNLEPRSEFEKKAKVNSNVSYSSFAYMCVSVPKANARLDGETDKSYQESIKLNFDSTNWTLVKKESGSDQDPVKYLYRYLTVVPAGAETGELFTKGTVPDFVECDALSGSIDVTGYMLSAVNVEPTEADRDAIANFFS